MDINILLNSYSENDYMYFESFMEDICKKNQINEPILRTYCIKNKTFEIVSSFLKKYGLNFNLDDVLIIDDNSSHIVLNKHKIQESGCYMVDKKLMPILILKNNILDIYSLLKSIIEYQSMILKNDEIIKNIKVDFFSRLLTDYIKEKNILTTDLNKLELYNMNFDKTLISSIKYDKKTIKEYLEINSICLKKGDFKNKICSRLLGLQIYNSDLKDELISLLLQEDINLNTVLEKIKLDKHR